jgi:hypothetical protein
LLQAGMDGRGAGLLQQAAHPGTAIGMREGLVLSCETLNAGGELRAKRASVWPSAPLPG